MQARRPKTSRSPGMTRPPCAESPSARNDYLPLRVKRMNIRKMDELGILSSDLDYHLVRASMVIIFAFFGYQKWFEYEANNLLPFISNGPFIFWLYPAFGIRGATYFLGVSEWLFGALLFLGFWNK